MGKPELNPFDLMDYNVKPLSHEEKQEQGRKARELDELIHQTFYQTESGKRLLERWKRVLITNPVVRVGEKHDAYDIGIAQGTMDWIRNIIITCEKVESGEY